MQSNELLTDLSSRYNDVKDALNEYPTAALWMQNMSMVDILREFVKAERTGNWLLHLKSSKDMLPFFAACGHNNYVKSVHVYLQNMAKPEKTQPEIYRRFLQGYYVVRRSERYWAGLLTDLVIDQSLMRSGKSVGGLTRGRGVMDSQRVTWTLSTPACSAVVSAMQSLTKVESATSDQHKDSTPSRILRDQADTNLLGEFFEQRYPFEKESNLRCGCSRKGECSQGEKCW